MTARAAKASVRHALRASTVRAHAQVDAFFPEGLSSRRDYRIYLRGMHALLSALQEALAGCAAAELWNQSARLAHLRQDLAALDAKPLTPAGAMRIAGAPGAAGALYVVEGSALGARLLLADTASLGYTEKGANFLRGHAADAQRWRRFVAWLEAQNFDSQAERAMFESAAATFACAKQEFRRAALMEQV